jgi:phage baseplate assembly protein W
MNVIDFLGRGWKYPVSIDNGKIAISEDEDSVRESIKIILGTAKGERIMNWLFLLIIPRLPDSFQFRSKKH